MTASRNKLWAAREKAGLPRRVVAEKVGIHLQTLWRWEHGKHEPCASALARIAKVYRCSVDSLIG